MPPTPERLTALATLLRAITAMLMLSPPPKLPQLTHWGRELHDRFALPFYLRTDLWDVLDELASAGLGLGQPLITELLDEQHYSIGQIAFGDCQLTVQRALDFWPLLGNALSQEHGHSRLVDASTARLEISLRTQPGAAQEALADWQLTINGYRLPMRRENELDGETKLYGRRNQIVWCALPAFQTLDRSAPQFGSSRAAKTSIEPPSPSWRFASNFARMAAAAVMTACPAIWRRLPPAAPSVLLLNS